LNQVVRFKIRINKISEDTMKTIIAALEPDNHEVADYISIKYRYSNGDLEYIVVNPKGLSSAMHTLEDIIRNMNVVLRLTIPKEEGQ